MTYKRGVRASALMRERECECLVQQNGVELNPGPLSETDITLIVDALQPKLDTVATKQKHTLETELSKIRITIKEYKEECKSQYKEMQEEITTLKEANRELLDMVNTQESLLRKNNILIHGIDENDKLSAEQVVRNICSDLHVDLSSDSITEVFRIGRNKGKRPIVCKFTSFNKKKEIMDKNRALQSNQYYINHDLSKQHRDAKKYLKPYRDHAMKNNLTAYIRGTNLIINGQSWTFDELRQNFGDDIGAAQTTHMAGDNTPALPQPTQHAAVSTAADVSAPPSRETTDAQPAPGPSHIPDDVQMDMDTPADRIAKRSYSRAVKGPTTTTPSKEEQTTNPDTAFIVGGDFNARIGDETVSLCEVGDHENEKLCNVRRTSKDKFVSREGRKLLKFCEEMCFVILNGSDEYNIDGNFTFFGDKGASVVDYILCSDNLRPYIKNFSVDVRAESDHMPLILDILLPVQLQNNQIESSCTRLTKYRWDPEKEETFKSNNHWYDAECEKAKKGVERAIRHRARKNTVRNITICRELRVEFQRLKETKILGWKEARTAEVRSVIQAGIPSQLWDLLRKFKGFNYIKNNIDPTEWMNHFRKVLGGTTFTVSAFSLSQYSYNYDLDAPFTESELIFALKSLKNKKAPGIDGIPAEFYKRAASNTGILKTWLQSFNAIFAMGEYHSEWETSIIHTIYKNKGDKNSPDNYRGIALAPVLSKVYSKLLYMRLQHWALKNNKLSHYQAGFRPGYCTVDNIFILDHLIKKYLSRKKGKLYCAFIDFQKAFDSVNRKKLWARLYQLGCSTKMIEALMGMYKTVKFVIKCNNDNVSMPIFSYQVYCVQPEHRHLRFHSPPQYPKVYSRSSYRNCVGVNASRPSAASAAPPDPNHSALCAASCSAIPESWATAEDLQRVPHCCAVDAGIELLSPQSRLLLFLETDHTHMI
ncbi:hypothetical protein B566_EDAN003065, partial [Ephemera danica]